MHNRDILEDTNPSFIGEIFFLMASEGSAEKSWFQHDFCDRLILEHLSRLPWSSLFAML